MKVPYCVARRVGVGFLFLAGLVSLGATAGVTPEQFEGEDGKLNEQQLIQFLLVHDEISYQVVWSQKVSPRDVAAAGGDEVRAKEKKLLRFQLLEMDEKFGPAPYSSQDVKDFLDKIVVPIDRDVDVEPSTSSTKEGWFLKPLESGDISYGPILLRGKYEDWQEKRSKVSGSSLTWSRNRLENADTWLTKGALTYPIVRKWERTQIDRSKSSSISKTVAILPTVKWNYFSVNDEKTDVQELTFQVPMFTSVRHDVRPKSASDIGPQGLLRSDFYLTPFYLTDFSLEGGVVGAELIYEPILSIGRFQTGTWTSLFGDRRAAYLFRFIPGLQYNQVVSESPYILREKNDDMIAVTADLSLRVKPFGADSKWELSGGYKLLNDFDTEDDEDGYSDLWQVKTTWWFTEFVGLNLEYNIGDTPITKQEVDLVTLGLEVRL